MNRRGHIIADTSPSCLLPYFLKPYAFSDETVHFLTEKLALFRVVSDTNATCANRH
jgi:hypothetical protein